MFDRVKKFLSPTAEIIDVIKEQGPSVVIEISAESSVETAEQAQIDLHCLNCGYEVEKSEDRWYCSTCGQYCGPYGKPLQMPKNPGYHGPRLTPAQIEQKRADEAVHREAYFARQRELQEEHKAFYASGSLSGRPLGNTGMEWTTGSPCPGAFPFQQTSLGPSKITLLNRYKSAGPVYVLDTPLSTPRVVYPGQMFEWVSPDPKHVQFRTTDGDTTFTFVWEPGQIMEFSS